MFCNATITSIIMLDWLIPIPNFGLGMRQVPWPEMREKWRGKEREESSEGELRGEGSSDGHYQPSPVPVFDTASI